ncbi:MAG TPA: serine hydrolase domain-containing protein, partial [Verrucomicrobiae bacterium]|nr:serine hydrolase domain-containing protein [Verrucomicrobiae bacterium]
MREGKIPGAVFVVVQGDRVICEKAYGVSDLESRQLVSTDRTLFRVASISKILTAASALELVQSNHLDLHRDVNRYLGRLHVASAFGQPVTLFNLLTHSSGFDTCVFGYAARSAASRLSLRNYLREFQPERVRPPGRFSVYDNYGYALAGHLVQRVSRTPFADYVRERILAPLDMRHSSFAPDAVQRRHLAAGYWLDGETPRACGRSYVNVTPAAGLCTTASDMANLMVALLANQRPDGSNMFPAGVLRGLKTQQFGSSPDVPGRCFGFDCVSIAGRQALRQTGQWPGFNSVLLLFPKQHCGLFLAYNLCDYL